MFLRSPFSLVGERGPILRCLPPTNLGSEGPDGHCRTPLFLQVYPGTSGIGNHTSPQNEQNVEMWAYVCQDPCRILCINPIAANNHEKAPKAPEKWVAWFLITSIIKLRTISFCTLRSLTILRNNLHEINIIAFQTCQTTSIQDSLASNFKNLPSDVFLHLHPTILPVVRCHDSFAQHGGANPTAVASAAILTQVLLHAPPARGRELSWKGSRIG